MAQTIKIKRSTSTATPTSLSAGELAYSSNSNKLFIGHPDGSTGTIAIGGTYYTDIIDSDTKALTKTYLAQLRLLQVMLLLLHLREAI